LFNETRPQLASQVPIGEVVVGDSVLLQAGDRVPADGYMGTVRP
jgi:magnesium-transporting ATPase (P-type)